MLDDDDAILIELQPVVVNTSLVDDSPTERDPSLESEGNKVSEDRNKDRTSVHSTSFNFINSIIGAGIIGLPFALAECGFILGVILLFLVALICDYVARILVETGVKQNKHNFEVLADHLLGPKGYYAVVVSMFLFAFGAMVAYLVIIGDTVPMVFSHVFSESHPLASRRVCIVLFGILLIFPLCLLKSMANLAWSSSLSVLSVAVIVVAIVSQAPGEARDQGISAETCPKNFSKRIPTHLFDRAYSLELGPSPSHSFVSIPRSSYSTPSTNRRWNAGRWSHTYRLACLGWLRASWRWERI
eukprot:477678_1